MAISSINKRAVGDDEVFEATDVNLTAGVIAIASATASTTGLPGMKLGTDAALNVVGVVAKSCLTAANVAAAQTGTDSEGYPFAAPDTQVTTSTVYSHAIVPVTYTAAAVAYGAKLCAAASGAVRAWVSGTDSAGSIIGHCAQPGGVSGAGGVALAAIRVL